jgi:hypothetical protein
MSSPVPDLSNEWNREKLRNWMKNAKRLGRDDVYQAAFRQLCRVEGRNISDPLESEFAVVMRALEEALSQEAGKTKRLSRTRQKLARAGVRKTLAERRRLKPSLPKAHRFFKPLCSSAPPACLPAALRANY